jgi:hypothetical protein
MTKREAKQAARRIAGAWLLADASSSDLPDNYSDDDEERIRDELVALGYRLCPGGASTWSATPNPDAQTPREREE